MKRATINRHLRRLGVEVQQGEGYAYFTSRRFGHQIGESIYTPRLRDLTLDQWHEAARWAMKEHRQNGVPLATCARRLLKRSEKYKISKP